ncbi:disulfide bond formation protein B [Curtobacterium flaccumfaciens]|uniref:Disulfide bond formation protein B n=1 Tax=Curtobacterium poinsettiae TaxID=159612 RepID=A0A9Q9P9W9_9MICO|nr:MULTISPECIES: disulfide bond formation protein B [Curtobacterium]MBO9038256.1 disulfide bond formation protein B [Curtobacterium flaccumfaciens pv. flaccumfaciens]MCS6561541.1 disulfide bond formation protein B [Curtobacterium flaccumfaciens pv. poinsettiae]UXN26456.1 disulfide bond formation protein B [Curtobacterium flaccumfaciens]UXN29121.1 disulfide bond formation protein B [Curtobacterium flaccumfaciens]UYC81297.1 disulfide bond formation protein B [Curtobacterium flaccumfaciens pv. po
MDGWRNPARWARTGRWLLLPIAVLDWVALAPQTIVVLAFLIAVVGLAGMAAALVVHMLRRSRGAMAGLGVVLLLGGLVVFGLDPFPGSFPLIESWWPESITQPQHVGSAYWQLAGLGIELAGFALLATLLVVALTGTPRPRQDRFRS